MSSSPLSESLTEIYKHAVTGRVAYAGMVHNMLPLLLKDTSLSDAQKLDTARTVIGLLHHAEDRHKSYRDVRWNTRNNPAFQEFATEGMFEAISLNRAWPDNKIKDLASLYQDEPSTDDLKARIVAEILKTVDAKKAVEQPGVLTKLSTGASDEGFKALMENAAMERLAALPVKSLINTAVGIYYEYGMTNGIGQKMLDTAFETVQALPELDRIEHSHTLASTLEQYEAWRPSEKLRQLNLTARQIAADALAEVAPSQKYAAAIKVAQYARHNDRMRGKALEIAYRHVPDLQGNASANFKAYMQIALTSDTDTMRFRAIKKATTFLDQLPSEETFGATYEVYHWSSFKHPEYSQRMEHRLLAAIDLLPPEKQFQAAIKVYDRSLPNSDLNWKALIKAYDSIDALDTRGKIGACIEVCKRAFEGGELQKQAQAKLLEALGGISAAYRADVVFKAFENYGEHEEFSAKILAKGLDVIDGDMPADKSIPMALGIYKRMPEGDVKAAAAQKIISIVDALSGAELYQAAHKVSYEVGNKDVHLHAYALGRMIDSIGSLPLTQQKTRAAQIGHAAPKDSDVARRAFDFARDFAPITQPQEIIALTEKLRALTPAPVEP